MRLTVNSLQSPLVDGWSKEHIEDDDPDLDFFILKVDLKNAFNKVSRRHFLRLVRKHFPGLARCGTMALETTPFSGLVTAFFAPAKVLSKVTH